MLRTYSLRKVISFKNSYLITTCHSTVSAGKKIVEDQLNLHHHNTSTITPRGKPKIPKREPLVKNFLIGAVDKDLLAFPEVIPRDDFAKLKENTSDIKNYFNENLDLTSPINSDTLVELKKLELFGLNIPQTNGGKGLFFSESLLVSEYENVSTSVGVLLSSHRSVSDIIAQCGTDLQKERYLNKLADGSIIATAAINESNPSNDDIFNTKATYDVDQNVWILNGEKSFVLNGTTADLFLVMAQSDPLTLEHERNVTCSFFLVNANTPGVSRGVTRSKLGDLGVEQCNIIFNNVKLDDSNIIGGKLQNKKAGETYMKSARLRSSLVDLELSKKIINYLTNYFTKTKQCGVYLKDMDSIKDKISTLLCLVYSTESMIYYTAGLIDEFDEQDLVLEAAITKYYSSQNLLKAATSALEFMGPKALMQDEPTEIFFRNAAELFTLGESLESLKCFIALTGLQHAGMVMQDDVTRSRNPLFNPVHMLKKVIKSSNVENISSNMGLNEYVHPSLVGPSECIELSIVRLKLCVEMLFNRYGNEIIERQVEMAKLTEIISICFAMYASISRANRSYCIGLRLADNEILASYSICLGGKERVKTLSKEIIKGPYLTNDNNLQKMSKQIFKSKSYFMEHPLTYNY